MRVSGILFVCVTYAIWIPHSAFAQKSLGAYTGGSELTPPLTIPLSNGDILSFTFRYCPAGRLMAGDPENNKPVLKGDAKNISAFFIAETEVSQKQFLLVLEEYFKLAAKLAIDNAVNLGSRAAGLQNVKTENYLSELMDEYHKDIRTFDKESYIWSPKSQKDKRSPKKDKGQDYPIYYLDLQDAVLFCVALNYLVNNQETRSNIKYRFRIPTNYEWQYACRTGKTGEDDPAKARERWPHFNPWPICPCGKRAESLTKKGKALTADLVKGDRKLTERLGKFKLTQQYVYSLLETARTIGVSQEEKAILYLQTVLESGLGYKGSLYLGQKKRGQLIAVHNGKGNSWNIKNMHGNVAEWTLDHVADWDDLLTAANATSGKDGKIARTSSLARLDVPTKKFVAAGGSFSFRGQDGMWKRITAWGGAARSFAAACGRSKKKGNERQTFAAGIRIVLEVPQSPKFARFVAELRGIVQKGEENEKKYAVANEQLGRIGKELHRITNVKLATDMKKLVTYYEGILSYNKKEYDGSLEKIRAAKKDVDGQEAEFLDALQYLVEMDRKKEKK